MRTGSWLKDFSFASFEMTRLRAAIAEDGAVVIRGALPPEAIRQLKEAVDQAVVAQGLAARTDDGVRPLENPPNAERSYQAMLRAASLLAPIHTLPQSTEIRQFWADLFGAPIFTHPGTGLRVMGPQASTTPHQDFSQFPTTDTTLAMWAPLHEVASGVLEFARASHRQGMLSPDFPFSESTMASFEWGSAALVPGDALIFSCLTVHRALPNQTGRYRYSIDFRAQPMAEPIVPSVIQSDYGGLSWEEIYAHVPPSFDRKYFWVDAHPPIQEVELSDALEAARLESFRKGDASQLRNVQFIREHSNDIGRRIAAKKLLAVFQGSPS